MRQIQTQRTLLPQKVAMPARTSVLPQKRKRGPKASVACETCRRLKAKCDQNMPCSICVNNDEDCVYRSYKTTKSKHSSHSTGSEVEGINSATRSTFRNIRSGDGARASSTQASFPVPNNGEAIGLVESSNSSAMPPKDLMEEAPLTLAQDQAADDLSSEDEPSPQGFGETNSRTNGKEFYGPAATLAFLLELRSRARAFRRQIPNLQSTRPIDRRQSKSSLVNMMDGDDGTDGIVGPPPFDNDPIIESPDSHRGILSMVSPTHSSFLLSNETVEKECISRYFANLHTIYYFLDRQAFMARCEKEIWSRHPSTSFEEQRRQTSKFPALYNAVVAVGALTAGDDILLEDSTTDVREFWEILAKQCGADASNLSKCAHLPRELAKICSARAKALLGDFFEACSLESQQTLFLLSIFCQYSLKPHSSYMYSGIAARTAMAIGSANLPDIRKNPIDSIRTWWCMFFHEMEVSTLLGRETFLRDPDHYPVFLAKFGDPFPRNVGPSTDGTLFFARSMTELARILKQISEEIYHTGSIVGEKPQINKHQAALDLDKKLLKWKGNLKPVFDLDTTSLTEKETVTKRKVVIELRYLSARIMIHRPFLVTAAYQQTTGIFETNVELCLQAARRTIQLLYDTFMHRPFFRTWWYNTTYAFNATSIILYSLVTRLHKGSSKDLLLDVEKTLKIFQAMDGIIVARRCAELTREILEVAKMALQDETNRLYLPPRPSSRGTRQPGQHSPQGTQIQEPGLNFIPETSLARPGRQDGNSSAAVTAWNDHIPTDNAGGGANVEINGNGSLNEEDFFANIMDANILDSFGANLNLMGLGFEGDLELDLLDFGANANGQHVDDGSYGAPDGGGGPTWTF